jgi:hypothetical protein
MPFNPTTERSYRGGNAIHLIATGVRLGYDDPRWMTYKQAADRGWQIRRAEKGTQIEFWEVSAEAKGRRLPDSSAGDQTDGEKRATRLIQRVYTVFNARQIDGVPAYQPKQRTPFEVVQSGESILENSGAKIRHDQADRDTSVAKLVEYCDKWLIRNSPQQRWRLHMGNGTSAWDQLSYAFRSATLVRFATADCGTEQNNRAIRARQVGRSIAGDRSIVVASHNLERGARRR